MSLVLRIEVDDKKAAASIKRFAKRAGADVKSLATQTTKSGAGMSAAFGKVGDSTVKMRQSFSGISGTLGAIRNQLLVFGFATAGVVAGIKSVISASSDLTESMNAVQVVFKEGSDNILNFGKIAADSVGLANAEFNQLAAVTGALLRDVGKPMDEVAALTIRLTERAADLASVFNTEVSDAMGAVNAAIRGETEAIRRFGGDVTDASLQQFLLANGINTVVSSMTQQEKRLLRIKVLFSQTDDVQGDFKETQDQLANATRTLGADIKNLAAEIGDELIPMAENAVSGLGKLVTVMKKLLKLREALRGEAVPFGGIVEDGVTRMRIAIQKMGEDSPEEIKKLAAAFASGIPLAQLFFLSIDEGFDRIREKKIELPEFLRGKGDVPLKGLRTELGLIQKQTESLATTEVTTLLTAFENVKIEAFNIRNELLRSNGVLVDIDLIMLRQLERMEETAEVWQTKMNPAAAEYLAHLRDGLDLQDASVGSMSSLSVEFNKNAALAGAFADAMGRAAIESENVLDAVRNIAKQLAAKAFTAFILSLLPGAPGFSKLFFGFAGGTNFAPGGPALVGERGPEIVNLPRGSQVIPSTQTQSILNNNKTEINISVVAQEFDEFFVRSRLLPIINEAVENGARNQASDLI